MTLLIAAPSPDNDSLGIPRQTLYGMSKPFAPAAANRIPDRDWLLDLATTLQTTLDIERLFGLFFDRLREVVEVDGAALESGEPASLVALGEAAAHRWSYDIVVDGRCFGRVDFVRRRPFGAAEVRMMEDVLANFAYPLRNALLYAEAVRAAITDPLTGAGNRSHLDRVLAREIDLAERHRTRLSVAMVDIDRFKSVNDRFGHPTGDRILRLISDCLRECARDSDMVFRYGGEEFCLMLSNTALDGAERLAERIRASVERLAPVDDGNAIELSVSVGVATLEPEETAEGLIERADQALYRAKQGGRNRVESSPGA